MKTLLIFGILLLSTMVSLEASAGTDLQCIRQNVGRCLNHFDRPTCAQLLRQACVSGPQWNRRCVKRHAHRCFLALLDRQQCKRKLRPFCFVP